MAPSLANRLENVHPQMLRVGTDDDSKKLAVGRSVERAFGILGVSKQDAAYRMGYSDPGTVSRWCAGTERPHFDKLFGLDGFEEAWIKARATTNKRLIVRTVIEIEEQTA